MSAVPAEVAQPLKIDIGCGRNKKAGFIGFDQYAMDGVDVVGSITDRWPWEDGAVDEVHCSHVLEHLTNMGGKFERVHFFNELYRVLKPGTGTCTLILPHWASSRYYGDPTHCEPFSEFGFYYLDRDWRATNAPHADVKYNPKGYACHLAATWSYSLHPTLTTRNSEYVQHAMTFWLESRQDTIATITRKD